MKVDVVVSIKCNDAAKGKVDFSSLAYSIKQQVDEFLELYVDEQFFNVTTKVERHA